MVASWRPSDHGGIDGAFAREKIPCIDGENHGPKLSCDIYFHHGVVYLGIMTAYGYENILAGMWTAVVRQYNSMEVVFCVT